MKRKAVISIALNSVVGSMQLKIPTRPLPRRDKKQLELTMARRLLSVVQQRSRHLFAGLRTNCEDPPDVLFEHNGATTGIELTELLPANRLEKDAIICLLRAQLLSRLNMGPKTRNRVVHIFLVDDYSEKLRPGQCIIPLAEALNAYLNSSKCERGVLPVPSELQDTVSRISVRLEDLTGDPRLDDEDHPLIIFGAQHTMLVPQDDIPDMLDAAVGPKLRQDLDIPTWLVLWSSHSAIGSVQERIASHLPVYLSPKKIRYQHVFYLGFAPPGIMIDIPVGSDARPLIDVDGT